MNRRILPVLAVVALAGTLPAEAGKVVEVQDPRQLQQQQAVIFPHAEVKVVSFEFESVATDSRGKEQAKALHDSFLTKISNVSGGAIVTYVTPADKKIDNYRATVERIAKEQGAQIAVWGSVLPDQKGAPRTNAHIVLVEPPPGISSQYTGSTDVPGQAHTSTRGVVDSPVTQTRMDFTTVTGDISPLADFLAGLSRYYKGTAHNGTEANRWLTGSITDFRNYLSHSNDSADASIAAQAYLYIARSEFRLVTADKVNAAKWLNRAQADAAKAVELNPYSSEAPTVQAVIAAQAGTPSSALSQYLTQAVKVAPLDATVRVNAAMFSTAQGKFPEAVKQLDSADAAYKLRRLSVPAAVQQMRVDAEVKVK